MVSAMRRSRRWVSWVVVLAACHDDKPPPPAETKRAEHKLDPYASDREHMVRDTIAERGVRDERVLEAMRSVPRHEFVPIDIRDHAYEDRPQPIGFGLTISQPYIVATMTEAAQLHPGDRVLEIGTGSGYQAAVLAELSAEVYTIEIVEELAKRTQETFKRLGLDEIHTRIGDGYDGWRDAAPFDAIIVTAAPPTVPPPLLDQLRVGGRLVAPVGGDDDQQLKVFTRTRDGITERTLIDVRFGPMTGKAKSTP
jgi:protein-L-isoaspartate(D-aspartate) O-methyltransferase